MRFPIEPIAELWSLRTNFIERPSGTSFANLSVRDRGSLSVTLGRTRPLNASLTAQGKLSKPFVFSSFLQWSSLQGAPSGRGTISVEIKSKFTLQYELLLLNCNCYLDVNKILCLMGWNSKYLAPARTWHAFGWTLTTMRVRLESRERYRKRLSLSEPSTG